MNSPSLEALLDRIEELTARLEHASDAADGDHAAVRSLLDEYGSALAQLRAEVREAERRLSSVAKTVDEGNRLVRKEKKKGGT